MKIPCRWFCALAAVGLIPGVSCACGAAEALDAIRARGVLLWGADAEGGAPYVYTDPQNPTQLVGFEYELAEALASKLGVKARVVQNQWDQLVPALERGSFDMILNGFEITPEHQQRVALSRPYYTYKQQIVTRRETQGVSGLADLAGKKVGVLSASVAQRLVEKMGGADLKIYPGNVECFRDLKALRIDAVVLDLPIAIFYAKPDPELKFSGAPFARGYYAIGVRKQDRSLLAAINQAITDLEEQGVLERIYGKYGLWNEDQAQAREYASEPVVENRPLSTLQQWPKYFPLLLRGAVTTVELSVLGMMLAVAAGLILVLLRLFGTAPLSWLAKAYIEVIRGTPLLIQLFFIYYALPELGIRLNAFVAAVLGLGLNYAANEAENYRAGIESLPKAQMEASLALGLSRWQALRHVILPQALRLTIPPVTNDFIAMFKDSSLVSVITMVELTKVYGMLATATYDYLGLGLMTAALYFGLSYPASILANRLERKLQYDRR
jgi:polar amino acid transport system substrate-binding protein